MSPIEYETELNWYDAILYCSMIEIDGHNDWRLPTIRDFEMIDRCLVRKQLYGEYWTSSQKDAISAFIFADYGRLFHNHVLKSIKFLVRPVRTVE